MHRRRALGLFATVIGISVSSQADVFADPASCPEHVAWVGKVMEKIETIQAVPSSTATGPRCRIAEMV